MKSSFAITAGILSTFILLGCSSTSALGLAKADHVDEIYADQQKMQKSIEELQIVGADNVEAVQKFIANIDVINAKNDEIVELNKQTNARMGEIEGQLETLPVATLRELITILASHLNLEVSEIPADSAVEAGNVETGADTGETEQADAPAG